MDTLRIRRESLRWYVLLALNNARPSELVEQILQATMRDIFPDATPMEVRRALDYLEGHGFLALRKTPTGIWWSKLTTKGTDYVEYNSEDEVGIARPQKYWGDQCDG